MRDISAIWRVMHLFYDCSAAADETGCHIHRLRRIHRPVGREQHPPCIPYFHWGNHRYQFETASVRCAPGVEIRRDPSASAALPCRVGRIFIVPGVLPQAPVYRLFRALNRPVVSAEQNTICEAPVKMMAIKYQCYAIDTWANWTTMPLLRPCSTEHSRSTKVRGCPAMTTLARLL